MSKRIVFLDYARAFALFLVVFAHLYSIDSKVKLYVYAFHMPFFFLISGYLRKDTETIKLLKKLTNRLLIPFCFFLFIGYCYFVISSKSLAINTAYASLTGIIFGKAIAANDILWFLLALFHVRIIGNTFIRNSLYIRVPLVALYFILCLSHNNTLYLGTSMMALPFYLVGYYAKKKINILIGSNYCLLISLACFVCTIIITNINGKVSMMGMSFGKTSYVWLNMLLFYLNGIFGSIMLMCLSGLFRKESYIVRIVSKCSISIVGLQFIPIIIWMNTIGFNQSYSISILYSIMIIVFSVLFHLLVEKKANWLLGGK